MRMKSKYPFEKLLDGTVLTGNLAEERVREDCSHIDQQLVPPKVFVLSL